MSEPRCDPNVKVGSRVKVQDVEGNDLGYGTYAGDVPLKELVEDPPSDGAVREEPKDADSIREAYLRELLEDNDRTPMIVLDSGQTIYGFECWWTKAD